LAWLCQKQVSQLVGDRELGATAVGVLTQENPRVTTVSDQPAILDETCELDGGHAELVREGPHVDRHSTCISVALADGIRE
jgi:hypothetical protein